MGSSLMCEIRVIYPMVLSVGAGLWLRPPVEASPLNHLLLNVVF